MGTSTTIEGELTIPTTAFAAWAKAQDIDPSTVDAKAELFDALILRSTEHVDPDDAIIQRTVTADEVTIDLYGDWVSGVFDDLLRELAELGVRGRVYFTEDHWGCALANNALTCFDGHLVWPDDELLLITVAVPDMAEHRAVFVTEQDAYRSMASLLERWHGHAPAQPNLDAALTELVVAGATITRTMVPVNV